MYDFFHPILAHVLALQSVRRKRILFVKGVSRVGFMHTVLMNTLEILPNVFEPWPV